MCYFPLHRQKKKKRITLQRATNKGTVVWNSNDSQYIWESSIIALCKRVLLPLETNVRALHSNVLCCLWDMVQNTTQCFDFAVKTKYLLKLQDAGKCKGLASSELREEKGLYCYCMRSLYPQTWKGRAMCTRVIYDLPPLKSELEQHCLLLASVLFWETGLRKDLSNHWEFIAGIEEETLSLPMLLTEPPCPSLLFQSNPKL